MINNIILKRESMKKIEAIIRTSKFEEIKAQLKEIGIDFFSYWDASGVGNEHLRGTSYLQGNSI